MTDNVIYLSKLRPALVTQGETTGVKADQPESIQILGCGSCGHRSFVVVVDDDEFPELRCEWCRETISHFGWIE